MKHVQKSLFLLSFFSCFFHFFAFSDFSNVLLIINYNHPHYETLDFIKELYKPFFPSIVFYGPQEHSDVHLYDHSKGYLSYLVIADAMKKYPSYGGYLFCHDDCIMLPWQFSSFDTKKIWVPRFPYLSSFTGNPINLEIGINWHFWSSDWCYPAAKKAYDETPQLYKNILAQNWGASHVLLAYSDIVYIPAQYATDFINLATIYGKHPGQTHLNSNRL
jgi:hypothetical protein